MQEVESDRLSEWKTLIQSERDDLLKSVYEWDAWIKHDTTKDGGSDLPGEMGGHGVPTDTTSSESGTNARDGTVPGDGTVEWSRSTARDRTAETGDYSFPWPCNPGGS